MKPSMWSRGGLCALLALMGTTTQARAQDPGVAEAATEDERWPPGPAPGTLDATFGSGGKVVTDISAGTDEAQAVAVQADGKIVVTGWALTGAGGTRDFATVRYLPDGSLDTSFGSGGIVLTDFFGGNDLGSAVVVQRDGRIVVGGIVNNPGSLSDDFGLARYNPDGTLDSTFGSGGRVVTDFDGRIDGIQGLALQPNGRIVAVGNSFSGATNHDFGIVRYRKDGRLDPSFGSGGRVLLDFFGGFDIASGVVLLPGCKLLVGGMVTRPGTGLDFGVVRLKEDGTLDTAYGSGGLAAADYTGLNDAGQAIALAPGGHVVVTGWADTGPGRFYDFGAVRFDKEGRPDSRFGVGGKTSVDFFFNQDLGEGIAVQHDGRILVTGTVFNSTNWQYDMGLARLKRDGSLDTSFGEGGKVVVDFEEFPGTSEGALALVVQPDGDIVVVGNTGDDTNRAFAVARFVGGKRH
ncbi:hypothetical protein ACN28E_22060 [Archangium lansingense]|uniref:hypothetical protein n=1 Tax=Archangium lansingense TaxID=2995310 RepID=UPI003B812E94